MILTGADSLLTSGGAGNVLGGAATIAALARHAARRIRIIAGGGLRLKCLPEVVHLSGVLSLHGSLTHENGAGTGDAKALEANVREALRILRRA